MTTPDSTLAARLAELPLRFMSKPSDHWRGEVLLPVVYADPGTNGFYYREVKPDSVAAYIRCDLIANAFDGFITTAEADARVKAAVLAEMEAAKSMVWTLGHEIKASMLVDEDNEQAVLDMVKATAAAIRARGVTG